MSSQPEASLDEMRHLMARLPGPDLEAATAAMQRERRLDKRPGGLGRLEDLARWLATWQGRHPPTVNHPRTAVFAASHGIAALGLSPLPPDATRRSVKAAIDGGGAANQLCRTVDADLRVYEMALDQPSADFTDSPALTDEECARAMAFGMTAVETGVDLLALGEISVGGRLSAAAIAHALFGGTAEEWTEGSAGAVVTYEARRVALVERAVGIHKAAMVDPFDVLRCVGGLELAAIVGAVLAARMARVPVLLDGFATTAAAAVLYAADKRALDHCLVAHRSTEPAHGRLLEILGQKPLLDLGISTGEAAGATLAIGIVKAAVACHNGMSEAGDERKPRLVTPLRP